MNLHRICLNLRTKRFFVRVERSTKSGGLFVAEFGRGYCVAQRIGQPVGFTVWPVVVHTVGIEDRNRYRVGEAKGSVGGASARLFGVEQQRRMALA